MSNKTLTHRDLSRMLGVSETTIKSYRRKFPGCIPVASKGKPIRFTEEAGQVCLKIRELFSRGMSIEEVRGRLHSYFDWIEPYTPEEEPKKEEQQVVVQVPSGPLEMPEDFTQAVSNLAKSMVKLTMQQDTILKKMNSIDKRLEQLGLNPPDVSASGDASAVMSAGMEQWMQQAHTVLERMENLACQVAAGGEAKKHSKVVRVTNTYGDVNEYCLETEDQEEEVQVVAPTPAPEPRAPLPPQDPPRRLLTLPLVIQTVENEYIGVAGKSRGRFNINDFKAMLMAHFGGNERYSNHWQLTPNGWLFALEQRDADTPKNLALLVEQRTTPRGNDVALIQHLTINGHDEDVGEVVQFIKDIYEA